MNVCLGIAFAACHKLGYVLFSFSFVSRYFLISLHFFFDPLVVQEHTVLSPCFWEFSNFLFINFYFIPLWFEKMHDSFSILKLLNCFMASVQFSRSVVSDSLRPHGLQHARPPCPSPTPRVYSNSCPLSRWCHPTILSSVGPFSSCPQSFPPSGSFQMSQLFASGGQSMEFQLKHQPFQWTFRTDFL